jgi:hypothetical protein
MPPHTGERPVSLLWYYLDAPRKIVPQGGSDVFANPVRLPDVLSSADVLGFLRLITSPASRRENYVPLSAVAGLADLSRYALYCCMWFNRVSEETCERLTPIVRAYEAGQLRFKRDGGRSKRIPNHWEMIEPEQYTGVAKGSRR